MPPEPQRPADDRSSEPNNEIPPTGYDEDTRLFYETLEQTGELIDVGRNADLAALPAHVTHVRYPDGTVERIGFTSSPDGV